MLQATTIDQHDGYARETLALENVFQAINEQDDRIKYIVPELLHVLLLAASHSFCSVGIPYQHGEIIHKAGPTQICMRYMDVKTQIYDVHSIALKTSSFYGQGGGQDHPKQLCHHVWSMTHVHEHSQHQCRVLHSL
jgi:hypothetical protein